MTDDDFTTRLLAELNLDDVDETKATINNLMNQARAVLDYAEISCTREERLSLPLTILSAADVQYC